MPHTDLLTNMVGNYTFKLVYLYQITFDVLVLKAMFNSDLLPAYYQHAGAIGVEGKRLTEAGK